MDKAKKAPEPLQRPEPAKERLPQPGEQRKEDPKYVRGIAAPDKRG